MSIQQLRTLGVRRLGVLALGLVMALATQTGSAAAEGDPWLKERVEVFEDLVRLGDLFENAGNAADIAVFRSPDLGTEGNVSAKRVTRSAKQHGVLWTNPGGIERIIVRRPSRHISLENVRQTLAKHIAGELDLEPTATIDIKLEGDPKPIHLNPKVVEPLVVRELQMQPNDNSFRAVMGIKDSDFARQNFIFHGSAIEAVELLAPKSKIDRGQEISEADLTVIRLPKNKAKESYAVAAGQLIGMSAKRRLRAGQPINRSDVEAPKIVERNAVVTVLYRAPGMILKTKGRATVAAARGEIIPIVNMQTKRTLQARIVNGDTAEVISSAQAAADTQLTTGSIAARVKSNSSSARQ